MTTDFLTVTQQLRQGEGVFDGTIVNSPAGVSVELNRFTFTRVYKVAVGFGFRVIAKGSVANNVNAKSIALGVNSLNPNNQISVAPAVSTPNVWMIDCTFICSALPTTFFQFGTTYTGPHNAPTTATTLFNLQDSRVIDFTQPPNFFVVIGSQVAAADIRLNGLYVLPLGIPA